MRRIMILAGCLLLLAAPAMAQSKASIQKLENEWGAAFNKGDAAAVAAMYTKNAYVMPPDAGIVKGRSAIRAFWGGAMKGIGHASCTTLDVLSLGSAAAREIGTCELKTRAQPAKEIAIKYAVVWRKVSGHWKLAVDIWNGRK